MEPEPEPTAPFRLEALTATRGLRGDRVVHRERHELVDELADRIQEAALARVQAAGVFHLALSGGSTPRELYQLLMIEPGHRLFPWAHTHLWLVDDRCVRFDDERSNYRMIRELIVEQCDLPELQVHPMPVLEAGGDRQYERDLRRELLGGDGGKGRLDFILLGMGGDGHTASLFPHTPALAERERWVVFNDGDAVAEPRPRMTMTYPLINRSRQIALLVTGAPKHARLRQVALAGEDIENLPVTGVQAADENSTLTWYLDHAAATGKMG
ncbi:MAG: 6-phosphogluconolactonase [Phycisphaerae bacterium]|nr:6-phosphogluconolactonase [Phycisphaerae bacterium]